MRPRLCNVAGTTILMLMALNASVGRAGMNANGVARLSWEREVPVPLLPLVPDSPFRLFLLLENVPDMRKVAVRLAWTPNDLVGPCFYPVSAALDTMDCGWTTESATSQEFHGDSTYNWTIHFPPSDSAHRCVAFVFAGGYSAQRCAGRAAAFCLVSVVAEDGNGALDTLFVPSGAYLIHGETLACDSVVTPAAPLPESVRGILASGPTLGRGEGDPSLTIDQSPSRAAVSMTLVMKQGGTVDLAVYDIAGRRVRSLTSGEVGRGVHRITWDTVSDRGEAATPGMYFVRLRSGSIDRSVSLVLVR